MVLNIYSNKKYIFRCNYLEGYWFYVQFWKLCLCDFMIILIIILCIWCHSWWSLCVICAGFLYIHVLLLEIQLSRVERWDPINWFDPATFLCLSQTLTWVSIVTCHVLYVSGEFSQNERWLLVLLLLVELMTIAG